MRSGWLVFSVLMLGMEARAETQSVTRLPEVVVTPTRSAEHSFDLPFTLNSLDAVQLAEERQVRTVPEALKETPAVMVQKTAHGQGSPFIRGFTGFRTLFLIDGIRLNNSTFRDGPNQYWNTVDPASIERLELVKGPGSVLYGSDAIGGTVNALTIAAPDHPTAGARYRFASAEDSHTGRLDGGTAAGPVRLGGGVTVKSYGDLHAGAPSKRLPRTGYDEWDADAKVEYHLDEDRRWVAAFQHVDQDDAWRTHRTIYAKSFHGTTIGSDRLHVFDQNRDLGYVQFQADDLAGAVESVKLSASYQFQGEDLTRVRNNGVREEAAMDVHTLGLSAQLTSPGPVGTLTYGAEYYRDWVDSSQITIATNGTVTRAIQGPVGDDASYDLVGVYVQDQIPLGERVDLILGGRYTYARAEADRVRDPVTGLPTSVEEDWHSAVGSARMLWRMDAADHGHWFAGVSQGFRAPNLSDLTRLDIARSGEIETAAPGLTPEEFVSVESGVKTQWETVSAEVAYFHTFIQDMIVRQPTGNIVNGANEVTKRNSGSGFVHGVECRGHWQFHPQWSAFGWVTWMEGEVDGFPTSAPVAQREPLSRVMPLTGQLGLRWQRPDRRLWMESVVVMAEKQDKLSADDRRDTQRIPPGGTPGYAVWTVRAGWQLAPQVTLTAAVENILDKDYRVHGSGLNEPGRNVVISAAAQF